MEMGEGGGDWTGQMIVAVVFVEEGEVHRRGSERTSPLLCRVALASDCLTVARCRVVCDARCASVDVTLQTIPHRGHGSANRQNLNASITVMLPHHA